MLKALSAFFVLGALAAGLSCLTLMIPGTPLDIVWTVNPEGHAGLGRLGILGPLLMACVSLACLLAARGLWIKAPWGRTMAIGILTVNLIGDLTSAAVRGDPRPLIGLPVAGAMIAYLCLTRVRAEFLTGRKARATERPTV